AIRVRTRVSPLSARRAYRMSTLSAPERPGVRARPADRPSAADYRRAELALEPVGLPDRAHRFALHVGLEALDVELAVEVVGLVLQGLRHEAVAFKHHRVAVNVDAGDARPRVPHPGKVE